MNNKFRLIVFTILFCMAFAKAQEGFPYYEHYLVADRFLTNPSLAGATDDIVIRGTYRNQWDGLPESPNMQTISAHANIIDRLGAGFNIYKDQNGASKLVGYNLAAAYHIPIDEEDRVNEQFSFGVSYLHLAQSLDYGAIRAQNPNDQLLRDQKTDTQSYIGLGASFNHRRYFGGISVLDIPLGNNGFFSSEPVPTAYLLNGGYTFRITENLNLEPSFLFLMNTNNEKTIDLNVKAKVKNETNTFSFGFNFRESIDKKRSQGLHVSPLIVLEFDRLKIGYAYNIGLSNVALESNNGHLISVGYDLKNFFFPSFRTTSCNCSNP